MAGMSAIKSWTVSDDLWAKVEPLIPKRKRRKGRRYLRVPPHRDHADHSIVVSKIMIVVTRIMIVVTRIAHHGHGVRYPPDRGMAAGS